MHKHLLLVISLFLAVSTISSAQYQRNLPANEWVDSVFKSLNRKEKIAQLMVIRAHSNLGEAHIASVTEQIKKYKVGGLCFFQGGPVRQAALTNFYQSIAKTPLMVTIDGEWGLGMRLDSVVSFPRPMMMGAVSNAEIIYKFGKAVGEQCKRMGIHVNFAPVVDINNNPANPVINDRSFGEDKYKVALFGTRYMKGMQDVGIMACAKHFPGHGDVSVDSHFDLPVINKSLAQLDSLELYPFRELINQGVGSVMIAHLYIPAIDTTANQATSLSKNNVTGLLRDRLGFKGLTFTDALEMKGVSKFYPAGQSSVQSLIAGNDLLCLPEDIKGSMKKIRKAIRKRQIARDDFNGRVKKVLLAKYNLGLNTRKTIDLNNLTNELNANTNGIIASIAQNAITLLKLGNKTML
ncbi:MAG TPA: glycoside hydrolase family 3 N-terminal domain-containing protein, partial [Segetibacter sp.]